MKLLGRSIVVTLSWGAMNKQRWAWAGALSGALIGGYVYLSPFLAVNSLKSAIESRDLESIEKQVDFPALRVSLKEQVKASMMKSLQEEMSTNPFAALGIALAGPMVDSMVDATVTPAGLRQLLASGSLPDANKQITGEQVGEASVPSRDIFKSVSMAYQSFNRFQVSIKPSEADQKPVKLLLSRDGLVNWRLNGISLPL
jgi:hypothetical protein